MRDIRTRYLPDDESSRLYRNHPHIGRSYLEYCPTCSATGTYRWRGREHSCDCEEQLQLHKWYLASGIGVTYQRLDFDDYRGPTDVLDGVVKYLDRREDFLARGMGMFLVGSYGTGKCAEIGSMVNMADGTYRPVEQVWVGDEVMGGTVVASQSNGRRTVREIRTTWGHTLSLTLEHPVWVPGRGWVPAGELQVGDELLACTGWEPPDPEDHPDELYRLIGYLIADGSVSQSQVGWSKTNPLIVADFIRCAESQGFEVRHVGGCDYRVSGISKEWRELHLGSYKTLSKNKVVPDFVLRSSNAKAVQFLTAYLESDGHDLEFYSTSRSLLSGVQSLLTRIGVSSHLRSKSGLYQSKRHLSWRLSITGSGRDAVNSWPFVDPANRPHPCFREPDGVDPGLCRCGCGQATSRVTRARKGYRVGDQFRYVRGHHRARVNAEKAISDAVLRVAAVTEKPDVHTWSLQVEPTNYLWIGDVLTHNTMLANLVLKEMVKDGHTCFATTFSQTVEMFTAGWSDKVEKEYFQRKFIGSRVLLLDDLGRELRGTKLALAETTFDAILRQRVQAGRATIITTNMEPEELGDGYGAAILSLIREKSLQLVFGGSDFRIEANSREVDEIMAGEVRPIV